MIDLLILNSNGLPVFSDGIRISKSTTIDVLLRHGFKLVVNSTEYDVKAPQGFRMLSNNLYQLQVTVASSMFVVLWNHQCSWFCGNINVRGFHGLPSLTNLQAHARLTKKM